MGNSTKLSGYQLWISTQTWQRSFNQLLKPSDITHAQYMVLSYMAWADKKEKLATLSQNQLAQKLSLDAMMISNVLKALETKGWILRSPADKVEGAEGNTSSSNVLSVTDAGKQLIKKLDEDVAQFEKKTFKKTDKKFCSSLSSITDQLTE